MSPVRKTIQLLILSALAACAWLSLAAPASARPGMELALQDDAVFVNDAYGGVSRDEAYARLRQLGVTRLRVNIPWRAVAPRACTSRTAPNNPVYDYTVYDGLVNEALARGVAVQFALVGPAPAWANGKRTCSSRYRAYKPNPNHFREFARQTAAHFGGLVDRYSIWNEPNHVGWLAPLKKAPRLYRTLYVQGYRGIKEGNSGARVLIGETSPFQLGRGRNRNAMSPLTFLRKMTCTNSRFSGSRCSPLYADGYAHHPYDFERNPTRRHPDRKSVTMATLGRLTNALARLRRSRALRTPTGGTLHVWLTEYGYLRSGRRRTSESRRASYLKRAYFIARRNGWVEQMTHFLLVTPSRGYRFFDTSLVNRSGSPYRAFRSLSAYLN